MAFSIVTVYWGNQKNLDVFIDHCSTFTDDIVVVYIDLFGYNIVSDKAKIVYLDHRFLLDNGYAKTFNLARNYANNNWVYLLGVGKEITSIDQHMADRLNSSTAAAYSVMLEGDSTTKWLKLSNTEKTNMVGVIHEEPVPMVIMGKTFRMSEKVFATWKYTSSNYETEYEKNVCDGYRALSRLKWYHLHATVGLKVKPQSFINSMEILHKQWSNLHPGFLNDLFNTYEYLYSLDKTDLVEELSKIDIWRQYQL